MVETTQQFILDTLVLEPLDPDGLQEALATRQEIRNNITQDGDIFRVLSSPVKTKYGTFVGVMQSSASLDTVNALQSIVLRSLVYMGGFALIAVAVGGWFTTRQALAPLTLLTKIASEINRADDLSRRIPLKGSATDEVGQLIRTFNQTIARLEQLFVSQRRLMADVGHELRTPLTVLKGNTSLMRRVGYMDDDSMRTMEREIDRLTRLVGDLMLLAQVESGVLSIDHRQVELDTILLDVMHQAKTLAQDTCSVVIDEIDQVIVCGDQDRLKQVALNLVANAVNYAPEGGEVILRLGKQDDWACLEVQDNGPGIPEEDIDYIFERFYRTEKSRSRKSGNSGFGLGLSIAYWIVEKHGGGIEVESKVGEGTIFTVWLPLSDDDCQDQTTGISQEKRWLERIG
ncbi:MAG: HAMP domain-containing histidine kinase [Chloroflexota bacterium]